MHKKQTSVGDSWGCGGSHMDVVCLDPSLTNNIVAKVIFNEIVEASVPNETSQ